MSLPESLSQEFELPESKKEARELARKLLSPSNYEEGYYYTLAILVLVRAAKERNFIDQLDSDEGEGTLLKNLKEATTHFTTYFGTSDEDYTEYLEEVRGDLEPANYWKNISRSKDSLQKLEWITLSLASESKGDYSTQMAKVYSSLRSIHDRLKEKRI